MAAVLILAAGGGVYFYKKIKQQTSKNSPAQAETANNRSVATNFVPAWEMYINEKYGFEFTYPGIYNPASGSDKNYVFGSGGDNNGFITLNIVPGHDVSGYNIYGKTEDGSDIYSVASQPPSYKYAITENNSTFVFEFDNVNPGDADKVVKSFKYLGANQAVDWKTYKNAKYGYEIKYPGDWPVDAKNPDKVAIGNTPYELGPGIFSITVSTGTSSVENFKQNYPGGCPADKDGPIIADAKSRYISCAGTSATEASENYFVQKNDNAFRLSFISGDSNLDQTFNQMLSFFAFINSAVSTSTNATSTATSTMASTATSSAMQIYQNKTYGFEFAYPNQWKTGEGLGGAAYEAKIITSPIITTQDNEQLNFVVTAFQATNTPQIWFRNNIGDPETPNPGISWQTKTLVINNYPAYFAGKETGDYTDLTYIISDNKGTILVASFREKESGLYSYEEYLPDFEQLVNSIKFN